MVMTASTMLQLGTQAPQFSLPDTEGRLVSLDDFREARALLVIFMSNHCPFVRHIREALVALVKEYQARGVAAVAINANDWDAYPDDSPQRMREDAQSFGYTFPYLCDETQGVAKEFRAACTPDCFLFDEDRILAYRGQMDSSRPGNDEPVTGSDLRAALDLVLSGQPVPTDQRPSLGCNIKWRPGNAPDYFTP